MSQPDDPYRPAPGTPPQGEKSSEQPGYGQPAYGQPQYGQPQHGQSQYGNDPQAQPAYGQPQYGQEQYGQEQYGQPQPYGQPQYGQQPYGQPQYGQPAYGQPYGGYGPTGVPARPASVIVAAVFGFLFGALGLLGLVGVVAAGSLISELSGDIPGYTSEADDVVGAGLVIAGFFILAYTVLMIWGAILALTGRSRVLLLVGGSLTIAVGALALLGAVSGGDGVALVTTLVLFAAAIAIVVLLAGRRATEFYGAHRFHRTGH
jgi:hypothetical protein